MTLTPDQMKLIYDISARMLQQDMLTNNLFQSGDVGTGLRNMALNIQKEKTRTNSVNDAVSGTFRADIAALGQASRNVKEASSMFGFGVERLTAAKAVITEWKTAVDKIADGSTTIQDSSLATLNSQYGSSINTVNQIINGTTYNGLYLFDGSKWDAAGEPFAYAGGAGKIVIQFGPKQSDAMTVSLSDLSGFTSGFTANTTAATRTQFEEDGASGISYATQAQQISDYLDKQADTLQAYIDTQTARQESLEFHSAQLLSQADLLQDVVDNRSATFSNRSLEQILLDLVMATSGTIFDQQT